MRWRPIVDRNLQKSRLNILKRREIAVQKRFYQLGGFGYAGPAVRRSVRAYALLSKLSQLLDQFISTLAGQRTDARLELREAPILTCGERLEGMRKPFDPSALPLLHPCPERSTKQRAASCDPQLRA